MKSMNRLKLMAVGVALVFTLGSQAAMAKGGPGGPGGPGQGGGHERGIVGCAMKLDLSTETTEAIQSLMDADREARETDRETMEAAREAYVAALTAAVIDEAALEEAQAAMSTLHQAHAEERFALDRTIVELLDADELAELADCLATPEEMPGQEMPGQENPFD